MNTDNNARYQETEERIMKAYSMLVEEKSAQQITVSNICRNAGIHRTTFYGHYCDVIDLEEQVERNQFVRLLREFRIEDGWDVERGMLAITGFCRRHKSILQKQLKRAAGGMDAQMVPPGFLNGMEEKFSRYIGFDTGDEHRKYYRQFCEVGIMALLAQWIESDCRTSDEEMAGIICDILKKIMTE